jgi:hypothetical protein
MSSYLVDEKGTAWKGSMVGFRMKGREDGPGKGQRE